MHCCFPSRICTVDKFEFPYIPIIAPFIDIPIFKINYIALHNVLMHDGAISKLLYGLHLYGR